MVYSDIHTRTLHGGRNGCCARWMDGMRSYLSCTEKRKEKRKKDVGSGWISSSFFFHYRAAQVQERAEYLCTLSSKGCFLAMPWCIRNNVIHFFHFSSAVETHCLFSLFFPYATSHSPSLILLPIYYGRPSGAFSYFHRPIIGAFYWTCYIIKCLGNEIKNDRPEWSGMNWIDDHFSSYWGCCCPPMIRVNLYQWIIQWFRQYIFSLSLPLSSISCCSFCVIRWLHHNFDFFLLIFSSWNNLISTSCCKRGSPKDDNWLVHIPNG